MVEMLDTTIWRQRAAAYRSLAVITQAPLARNVWLRLAEICEELADELEFYAMAARDTSVLH